MNEKIGDRILSPYTITDVGEGYLSVEFKTIYQYFFHFMLVGLGIGFYFHLYYFKVASICLLILYFFTIFPYSISMHWKIKRTLKKSSVEFSGSSWSFSNPRKARLEKIFLKWR